MPELKHNFLKGRMNKDLDERLVPDGEYRDALNIEINTSEDSDAGTAQSTMGNVKLSTLPMFTASICIQRRAAFTTISVGCTHHRLYCEAHQSLG